MAMDLGFTFVVQYLSKAPSDHAPILMSTTTRLDNSDKPFLFLNYWITHDSLMDIIRQNWQVDFVGDPLYVLAAKLRHLKGVLQAWSRESFGNIFNMVMVVKQEVSQLEVCLMKIPQIITASI